MKIFYILFEVIFETLEKLLSVGLEKAFFSPSHQGLPRFIKTNKVLKKRAKGFCLNGRKNLSPPHSYRNALIIGGTGTGKSASVLIPSLFSMKGSFVVHDPSGELFTKTSGQLQKRGYQLYRLNFSQPKYSSGYNPLSRIRSVSEINKIASLIINTALGGNKADPFWNGQGISLLAVLIHLAKYQEAPYQNLTNVKFMLQTLGANPDTIEKLVKQTQNQSLLSELQSFLAFDQKVKAGILATCLSALQLLKDPQIAAITSFDSLNFAELRIRSTAIFLQNPTADQAYYKMLSSLFLEQLIAFMLSRLPKKREQDIFCLVDEASSLFLPSMAIAVANVRKYRCGILLALQDFNQLIATYGRHEAETIRSNCFAKLYFGGQSLETAKMLESMLGDVLIKDPEGKEETRPLITRDEIRTLDPRRALLICGNLQPMLVKLLPYFKRGKSRRYSRLPFLEPKASYSQKQVQILPHLLDQTPKYGRQ